ncbi:hypothetical protein ABZZ44_19320 [Streptomyces sp. NPDC006460]|uniref:hypothetical protein n=1 Tax=Streptomyces sp. NPDC006460 TaxID=3154304 RepID=UPI0033B456D4
MGRTGTVGRRALLLAGAATLGGCTTTPPRERAPEPPTAAERAARAEAELRRGSAAAGRTLLERYDAVLAAHPSLAARLTPLRTSAAAHAAALAEGTASPGARPAPSPTGSGPAASSAASPAAPSSAASPAGPSAGASAPGATAVSPTPPAVPADPAAALRQLAAEVRRTSDTHTAALLDAPPEYARLLASVAAAGAAHAYLLTGGGRG